MNRRSSTIMQGALASLLLVFVVLFAGPALAADGRVLAAAGEVTVDRPEAAGLQSVAAKAGFELRAGDTIRTGTEGRAQIRLNDGAIFSLQPRTVFRIDEYRFDAQEQRGFFSLLRGALRTATGQIGKRDRDDYRLQTPTATVGIRGTQYLAQETVCDPGCWPGERAGLHVSVTEGRIAVTNDFGSIEIGAGEAAEVAPAAPPRRAALPPRLPPQQMLAAGQDESDEPGTETGPVLVAQATDDHADSGESTPGSAGASARERETAPVQVSTTGSVAVPDAAIPARSKPAPSRGSDNWDETLLARIDTPAVGGQGSVAGKERGSGSPAAIAPERAFDIDFAPNAGRDDSGALLAVNEDKIAPPTGPTGNTPGSGGTGDPGTGEPGTGDPGTGDPGTGDPGTGDPGTGEPGTGEPGDPGTGDPGTGDPGTGDPGTGDPGTGDPGTGDPGTGGPGDEEPGTGDPGEGEIPVDEGTTTGLWRLELRQAGGIGWLAQLMGGNGRLQFDAERRLTSIGFCPNLICLSSGSTRIAEAGADQWVSWGRWTEGTAILRVGVLPIPVQYSANTGMHYLVGSPALTVPTSGTFAYALAGATAPTMSGGQWAPGTFSGNASVNFEPGRAARLGLEASVAFGDNRFRIATEGGAANPAASQVALDSRHAFDATIAATEAGGNFCRGTGCEARIGGGLFGPNGERLGVGYSINGSNPSTTIDGVGVFSRQ